MAFTALDVKNLREKTGVGMMECKKALTEADGDMDRAFEILRERGLAASEKKASRIAAEGAVIAYTDEDAKVTVLLEINSETDFVGKNEKFQEFGLNVAKTIAANTSNTNNPIPNLTIAYSGANVKAMIPSMAYTNNFLKFHLVSPAHLSIFSYSNHFVLYPTQLKIPLEKRLYSFIERIESTIHLFISL